MNSKIQKLPSNRRPLAYFLLSATIVMALIAVINLAFAFADLRIRQTRQSDYEKQQAAWGITGYVPGTNKDKLLASLVKRPDANHVSLYQAGAGDDCLEVVGKIDDLRILTALFTSITDDGLVHLADKAELRRLSLYSTGIGDKGLRHLVNLTKLEDLSLIDTPVTDEGLRHLSGLVALKELGLGGSVEGDGLVHLYDLPNLEYLGLVDPRFDDQDMHHLHNFSNLKSVNLYRSSITNEGVAILSKCQGLTSLYLTDTGIDDGAVEHLKKLKNLKKLSLRDTAVTKSGIAELQAALPECRIIQTGDSYDAEGTAGLINIGMFALFAFLALGFGILLERMFATQQAESTE